VSVKRCLLIHNNNERASVFALSKLFKASIMFAIYEPILRVRHCEMLYSAKWRSKISDWLENEYSIRTLL